jgi:Putative Flp pilus-assembly TadE/G-like
MRKQLPSRRRHRERGQTMIFVAISIVSLLALAALAIDIVTLYVARTEIQRAADAAALAAAKAIADSGVTTLQSGDPQLGLAQTLAQNMATAAVSAMVNPSSTINLVSGAAPTLATPTPIPVDFTRQGNPHVTIALQRTNLPTFFSKIWARSAATVTATATAEVYNPANLPAFTPISPKSVKPWLVANADPKQSGNPFVNTATGAIEPGAIGEQFNLKADCHPASVTCSPLPDNPPKASFLIPSNLQVDYVPLQVVANSKNVCPPCAGATDYEQSIECADVNTYIAPSCGGGATNAAWDNNVNPATGGAAGVSASGAVCLTHASSAGSGQGQDLLNDPGPWPTAPFQIQAGPNNPQNGNFVATSNSIVTIPIIDTCVGAGCFPATGGPVTVIGFMQAFIKQVQDGTGGTNPGDINITVLNIAGCSVTSNGANPVVGGAGTSPVPVRLITPP